MTADSQQQQQTSVFLGHNVESRSSFRARKTKLFGDKHLKKIIAFILLFKKLV